MNKLSKNSQNFSSNSHKDQHETSSLRNKKKTVNPPHIHMSTILSKSKTQATFKFSD